MQLFLKTLLVLTCFIFLQIQSLPLSEEASLSIDTLSHDVKSTNINKYGLNARFLQGSSVKSSSTSAKITLKSGKWVAAIVGGAVLLTLCVGCAIFCCIKRRLDNLERHTVSPKITPFRPTKIEQLQYGQPGERLESDHSIIIADNSAIPFANGNVTIQPTFVGYEKQLNTEEIPGKESDGIQKKKRKQEEIKAQLNHPIYQITIKIILQDKMKVILLKSSPMLLKCSN